MNSVRFGGTFSFRISDNGRQQPKGTISSQEKTQIISSVIRKYPGVVTRQTIEAPVTEIVWGEAEAGKITTPYYPLKNEFQYRKVTLHTSGVRQQAKAADRELEMLLESKLGGRGVQYGLK